MCVCVYVNVHCTIHVYCCVSYKFPVRSFLFMYVFVCVSLCLRVCEHTTKLQIYI